MQRVVAVLRGVVDLDHIAADVGILAHVALKIGADLDLQAQAPRFLHQVLNLRGVGHADHEHGLDQFREINR